MWLGVLGLAGSVDLSQISFGEAAPRQSPWTRTSEGSTPTADVRESPALRINDGLVPAGGRVQAHMRIAAVPGVVDQLNDGACKEPPPIRIA